MFGKTQQSLEMPVTCHPIYAWILWIKHVKKTKNNNTASMNQPPLDGFAPKIKRPCPVVYHHLLHRKCNNNWGAHGWRIPYPAFIDSISSYSSCFSNCLHFTCLKFKFQWVRSPIFIREIPQNPHRPSLRPALPESRLVADVALFSQGDAKGTCKALAIGQKNAGDIPGIMSSKTNMNLYVYTWAYHVHVEK